MTIARASILAAVALTATACITEKPAEPETKPSPEEAAILNLQLGAQYLRQGDLERALDKLQKAVDQNPELPQAHATLALAYGDRGTSCRKAHYYLPGSQAFSWV